MKHIPKPTITRRTAYRDLSQLVLLRLAESNVAEEWTVAAAFTTIMDAEQFIDQRRVRYPDGKIEYRLLAV